MPLRDYQELLARMQRGLGKAFRDAPYILNLPGKSVACKIDPLYYLAVEPLFTKALARWSAVLPRTVRETLVRTGNAITVAPRREPVLPVSVLLSGRTLSIRACFIEASFIDTALRLYGGLAGPLDLSDLRIAQASRGAVEELFAGKTMPRNLAFG